MDTWNREELYAEIWEQPAVKVAKKYDISAVMLGKVCGKLQIPRPGRGYWARKEFGKPVEKIPLPEAKDLPVLQRLKQAPSESPQPAVPTRQPTDPEYTRILEVEARPVVIDSEARRHKLVSETAKCLSRTQPDNRGIVVASWREMCLDVRVSKESINRALNIMNAVVLLLESENFVFVVQSDRGSTAAQVFGHSVPFSIVEKLREKSRRQVREYSYTHTVIEYQPKGELEFRVGKSSYFCKRFRDGKREQLEGMIPRLAGAILLEGRARKIQTEEKRLEEIEERKRMQERIILSEQIAEEEKKVKELESWVTGWLRAKQMREFIAALEELWKAQGHDLSPEFPKGQKIVWMKHQADRLDPLITSPKSILDRKPELNRW